jgi:hypothetical protein
MTFGTLRSRVSSEMKRGELTADATAVATAIITAIDYFKRRRFPWNEFAVTNAGVTVPDQTDVTLSTSSRVITIDSLKIHIGQRDYPLTPTPFRSIDAVDSGQWAGYPEMYSFHHDMIRLYPIPNASYTIAVAGIWDLTELSAFGLKAICSGMRFVSSTSLKPCTGKRRCWQRKSTERLSGDTARGSSRRNSDALRPYQRVCSRLRPEHPRHPGRRR